MNDSSKILLIFAHFGEAQSFLNASQFSFKKSSEYSFLWESPCVDLMLSGEGIFETQYRLGFILAQKKTLGHLYRGLINLGICGALNSRLATETFVGVHTLYLSQSGKLEYLSFSSSMMENLQTQISFDQLNVVDLVSSLDRVLEPSHKKALSGFGDIVDRESWALAYLAKKYSQPWLSFKIVSDQAFEITSCADVVQQSTRWSQLLYDHFLNLWPTIKNMVHLDSKIESSLNKSRKFMESGKQQHYDFSFLLNDSRFHWTRSLQHQLLTLWNQGSISLKPEEIEHIAKNDQIKPKDRTRQLLDLLKQKAHPILNRYITQKQMLVENLKSSGIELKFDYSGEEEGFYIRFQCSQVSHLEKKIKALQQLKSSWQSMNIDHL